MFMLNFNQEFVYELITLQVKRLQKQLQQEIDLHSTLANAVEQRNSTTLVESPNKLPDKVS